MGQKGDNFGDTLISMLVLILIIWTSGAVVCICKGQMYIYHEFIGWELDFEIRKPTSEFVCIHQQGDGRQEYVYSCASLH